MRSLSAVPSRLLRKMCEKLRICSSSPIHFRCGIISHTWRHHHPHPSGSYCERHELNLAAFNHHVLVYWLNIKIIGPYFQNKSIHFSPFYIFIALVFYLWTQRLSFCYIWCLSLDICIQWVHTILMDLYVSDSQQIVQKKQILSFNYPCSVVAGSAVLTATEGWNVCWEKARKIMITNQFSAQLPAANPHY